MFEKKLDKIIQFNYNNNYIDKENESIIKLKIKIKLKKR